MNFLEDARILVEIFKKLVSQEKEREKDIELAESDQNLSIKSSGNLSGHLNSNTASPYHSINNNNNNNFFLFSKINKEEMTIKILLKIFILLYKSIEENGITNQASLMQLNHMNINANKHFVFNFQNNQNIGSNLGNNILHNENKIKSNNELLLVIFRGLNYFSSKYVSKIYYINNKREGRSKPYRIDNPLSGGHINYYSFLELHYPSYFNSKAELKNIFKISQILNKYNFFKSQASVFFNHKNQSPRSSITENNQNLVNNIINANYPHTIANQDNSGNLKLNNLILQKFLLKYSSSSESFNNIKAMKIDFVDDILDNISNIVKNFETIMYCEILEKLKIKNFEMDSYKELIDALVENSDFYLEIFKFLRLLSNNSGFTLFFIKSGIYLFNIYFMLKYENKFFTNEKIKNFLNEIAQHSYMILKNVVKYVRSYIKNHLPKSNSVSSQLGGIQGVTPPTNNYCVEESNTNANNNPAINSSNINLTLKNHKSEKFENLSLNMNVINTGNSNINTNNHPATPIAKNEDFAKFNLKLTKIYTAFDKAIRNVLQNYFYDALLISYSSISNTQNASPKNIKLEHLNSNTLDPQAVSFLKSLKSNIENPDFIWNKNYRKEMKDTIYLLLQKQVERKFKIEAFTTHNAAHSNNLVSNYNLNPSNNLYNANLFNFNTAETAPESKIGYPSVHKYGSSQILMSINLNNNNNNNNVVYSENIMACKSDCECVNIDHLEYLQNYEFSSAKKELRIGKIFIRVFNSHSSDFKLENPNQFLDSLKQKLIEMEFEKFNIRDFLQSFKIKKSTTQENKEIKETLSSPHDNCKVMKLGNSEEQKLGEIINTQNPNLNKDKEKDSQNNNNINNNAENFKQYNNNNDLCLKTELENPYFYYDESLNVNFNIVDELLKAISNVINNCKADETIILSDAVFIEKFYKLLNENINYNNDLKEKIKSYNNSNNNPDHKKNDKNQITVFLNLKQNLNKKILTSQLEFDKENIYKLINLNHLSEVNDEFDETHNEDLKIIDLIPSCLNLLYILSMINPESMKFVLNHNITFIILKIINNYNTKYHIDPILRILRLMNKNPEHVDKLNISIFLFFLKKIVAFRDLNLYIIEEEKLLNKAIDKLSKKLINLTNRENNNSSFSSPQKLKNNFFTRSNSEEHDNNLNTNNEENFSSNNNKIQQMENSEKIKAFQLQLKIIKEAYEKINVLGIDIIKIIKKFMNNERIGFAIKGIFEFYLPKKIIDNLFFTKETNENSIKCLGEELELPDLIWNKEAIQKSKKILDEDINFILNDEINLDNFPQNLITHKLSPQKCFFFEISDEYRLDNIYIRIFNKDPAYNLGKNLVVFLKQLFNDQLNSYKKLAFFKFLEENKIKNLNKNQSTYLDSQQNTKLCKQIVEEKTLQNYGKVSTTVVENLKRQILCGFTAILLVIEQMNFNDFNDNLGVSSIEEMKTFMKNQNEKHLISLVQRSFEYQTLIPKALILKLTNLILSALGLNENYKDNELTKSLLASTKIENYLAVDTNLRLVMLQILYLLCVNKKAINLIHDLININELLEKFFKMSEEISDRKITFILNFIFLKILNL